MAEKQHLMSRTAGRLMLSLAVALVALVLGPVSYALATPPQLTIEVPEGSPTNNPTPQLRGHTNDTFDEVTVKIQRVGGGGSVTISLSPVGEEWSVSPAQNLSDGQYTAQATQTNAAEETGQSGSVAFTIDTIAPTLTLAQPPGLSNNTKPTFSGSSTDSTTVFVHIYSSGQEAASASGVGGASWTAGNESSLPAGTYTARAEQTDQAGNTGNSSTVTFAIKTQGPAVTLNLVPTPRNIATPTLTGAAGTAVGDKTSVTVQIFKGEKASGTLAQTLTAPVSGPGWSAAAAHLADGTYTAQAEQSDEAANTAKSATSTFIVDTAPPAVHITVPSSAEERTSTPRFEGLAGTVGKSSTSSLDLPTVTLRVYAGSVVTGTPIREINVTAKGGSWSALISPALRNETYTVVAEQADEAGNRGRSASFTFHVVSTGPPVALTPIAGETNSSRPTFGGSAGVAPADYPSVLLKIFRVPVSLNSRVLEESVPLTGAAWSFVPAVALPDGTYTAVAEQEQMGQGKEPAHNPGVSESTFTIDTVAPAISLTSPSNGSQAGGGAQRVEGAAGTAVGDAPTVTVRLAAGASIGGQTLQTRVVAEEGGPEEGGRWHVNFEGLAPGTYTTQAEQSDAAGNNGLSQASTFTLTPPSAGSPPTAAFTWVPSTPHVGQVVSLLSSSSDLASPISGYAWDLTGAGSFGPGGPTNTTSFSSVGNHIVRLRVAAANGLSSVASATVAVTAATYPLMRPFPVVRISSIGTRSGVRLKLLRVQAPNGARITVTCRNRGCPVRSQHRIASAAANRVAAYSFHRFERALRAGMVLEVRVSGANQIGKYTRYTIRKGGLPQRVDLCLSPEGPKPIGCPS